jgi:hypothetical protein
MIRILPPVLVVLLVLSGLLLNERGLESLGDPVVVIAVLFLLGVSCVPLLRRTVKTQQRLARVPWLGLLLVWNGIGALLAIDFALSVILFFQHAITFATPPPWCLAVLFWLWFLPMPFTTLGVIVFLWRSHRTSMSMILLLYSLVVFAVWSGLIAMLVTFVVSQGL